MGIPSDMSAHMLTRELVIQGAPLAQHSTVIKVYQLDLC